ncbi:hypothetical protein N8667_02575 [Verrucomicrobia bacterium]|nr:hypothetical protein [Verrucomicrobiota bacterium]
MNLSLVLPLVLTKIPNEEAVLWLAITTVMNLKNLLDMGISITFTRAIGYALGGARELHPHKLLSNPNSGDYKPNFSLLCDILFAMKKIYLALAFVTLILSGIFGSIMMMKLIMLTENKINSWICWILVVFTLPIGAWGMQFVSFLQGMNKIALYRRTEGFIIVFSTIVTVVVLWLGPSLLKLVIILQLTMVTNVIANIILSRSYRSDIIEQAGIRKHQQKLFKVLWPAVWRSGLGIAITTALIQLSGLVYANISDTYLVATYMISLRLVTGLNEFARAPFYSKIPLMSRLRAQGNDCEVENQAIKGMQLSYWTLVISSTIIGYCGDWIFNKLGFKQDFPPSLLWWLLVVSFLFERFGAMHLQLYTTKNKIIWHKSNGGTCLLMVLTVSALFPYVGVYAFPCAFIAGYGIFYSVYNSYHSYKILKTSAVSLELKTSIPPLCFLATAIITDIYLT